MFNRRDFLQIAAATIATTGLTGCQLGRAAAGQAITQEDLLQFDSTGQVTLMHLTDCHAQLMPVYFREPKINLGVGEVSGLPPHVTGDAFLDYFSLNKSDQFQKYALTYLDFEALAKNYGKMGGMAQMATLVKAIRAERPEQSLLLDGGDTWQGSYTALKTRGEDMVKVMNQLGVDAMCPHWEFTYGQERVAELIEMLDFPFLAGNVTDTEWEERVFESTAFFERGGVKIAVIGQAFPYTPVANPRYMIPTWSFGINVDNMQEQVKAAKEEEAELIVVLSHNGFDVDRKMASQVEGIDVLLTGHTHDALPSVIKVGKTLLIASGSHSKFLSRLDLKVENKQVVDFNYKLIPILSDAIKPDPEMAQLVQQIREPHQKELAEVAGYAGSTLYRRGNFNGTYDDLICNAMIQERDAELSLSPGFRWGASLIPGEEITRESIFNLTGITYPNCYRVNMTGEQIKTILEDVGDNLFNPDPYYQQGGDMVRCGGLAYTVNIHKPMGQRFSNLSLSRTGEALEPNKTYSVAGWASVNEGTQGPPIWDVVWDYVKDKKVVSIEPNNHIKVSGA